MASLPPFLEKLLILVRGTRGNVGRWDDTGREFIVLQNDKFEAQAVRKHYKGSLLTFIRQLHFYGFKKTDRGHGRWGFKHPKFLRDSPHLTFEIKRKTRNETCSSATKEELQVIRKEMKATFVTLSNEIVNLKTHMQLLLNQCGVIAALKTPLKVQEVVHMGSRRLVASRERTNQKEESLEREGANSVEVMQSPNHKAIGDIKEKENFVLQPETSKRLGVSAERQREILGSETLEMKTIQPEVATSTMKPPETCIRLTPAKAMKSENAVKPEAGTFQKCEGPMQFWPRVEVETPAVQLAGYKRGVSEDVLGLADALYALKRVRREKKSSKSREQDKGFEIQVLQ